MSFNHDKELRLGALHHSPTFSEASRFTQTHVPPCSQAEKLLSGSQGLGRIMLAQRQLCTRRWDLVKQLSQVYTIMAVPPTAFTADGLLDEKFEYVDPTSLAAKPLPGGGQLMPSTVMTICRVPLDSKVRARTSLLPYRAACCISRAGNCLIP